MRTHEATSSSGGKVGVTYGIPHIAQHAPSLSAAPHEGQRFSSTSPQTAHLFAPGTGADILREGYRNNCPSTMYGKFDGQRQLGQYPAPAANSIPETPAIEADEEPPLSAAPCCSSDMLKRSASFLTVASESLVPSPASNAESAGCLQPISSARADCEIS